VLKWGAITFGVGVALVLLEIYVASKKKQGIEKADWKRIWGIVWITFFVTGLVVSLIWLS
jgi:hypothetical protein